MVNPELIKLSISVYHKFTYFIIIWLVNSYLVEYIFHSDAGVLLFMVLPFLSSPSKAAEIISHWSKDLVTCEKRSRH